MGTELTLKVFGDVIQWWHLCADCTVLFMCTLRTSVREELHRGMNETWLWWLAPRRDQYSEMMNQ